MTGHRQYANNNPYTNTDPDGRFVHVLIGAIAGAVISGGVEAFRQVRSGKGFDGKSLAIQVGKGAVVGAVTAAVPAAIASGALGFGGAAANVAVSLGNAAAAGAAGEVASQAIGGEQIDAGQALGAGLANAAGLAAGAVLAAPARALSTSVTAGSPGLPVTSLSGRTFMVGAEASETVVNEALQQSLQDTSGEVVSAIADDVLKDK